MNPHHNPCEVLEVESTSVATTATNETLSVPVSPSTLQHHIPKWERQLPKHYVIAATPSPHLLDLKVELQTMDTREVITMDMLLNCSATGLFIDAV